MIWLILNCPGLDLDQNTICSNIDFPCFLDNGVDDNNYSILRDKDVNFLQHFKNNIEGFIVRKTSITIHFLYSIPFI